MSDQADTGTRHWSRCRHDVGGILAKPYVPLHFSLKGDYTNWYASVPTKPVSASEYV